MSRIKIFLKELDEAALTTRKMLERIPTDKFDWQPHPKSMTVKRLATHIAELPSWISMALTTDELDFANNPYTPEDVKNTEELLAYFERSLQEGRSHLTDKYEEVLDKGWTLEERTAGLQCGAKSRCDPHEPEPDSSSPGAIGRVPQTAEHSDTGKFWPQRRRNGFLKCIF